MVELNRTRVIKVPPIPLIPQSASIQPPLPPRAANLAVANVADATLRGNITAKFITALPLSGIRSFDSAALLFPGVTPSPATYGANGPGIGSGVGTSGQFSVNGQRARANNFTIDGSDNNDQDIGVRRQGFTVAIPQTIESINEFQITTLLADAEAGRNIGAQVNVVSRSGEIALHGQLYDFFTDSSLNARDFFDIVPFRNSDKSPFTRNQFGESLGFPIIKNRLNFFAAFEQQDINTAQTTHFSVPTLFEHQAALSLVSSNLFGRDLLDLYPLPNNAGGPYGDNTFTQLLGASGRGTLFSLKLDYQFNLLGKQTTLFSRYNFTDDKTSIPAVDGAINSSINAITRTQNLAFTLDTILTNGRSNQVRFSFGRTSLSFNEVQESPFIFQSRSTGRDFSGDGVADGRSGPIGRLKLAPFSSIGLDPFTFPQGRANNTFQIADTFILTQGKNTLKFGADLRRVQFNSFLDRNYRPQITFTQNLIAFGDRAGFQIGKGIELASFGIPSDLSQVLAVTPDSSLALRFNELSVFAQNNFRIHPRVTIDAGLRYERTSIPTDATERLEDNLNLQVGDLANDGNGFIPIFLNVLQAQQQFVNGREKIYRPDKNNFAPRIGIAIDLTGDGRTSLRGGYGLFYDQILGNVVSQSRNIFPNFLPVNFGAGTVFSNSLTENPAFIGIGNNGNISLVQPGSINTIGASGTALFSALGQLLGREGFGLAFTLPNINLRTPYVHQYSVTLERSFRDRYIASIGYVATTGRKLIRFRTPNGGSTTPIIPILLDKQIIDAVAILDSTTRPNRNLGAFTVFESSAESNYQALQTSLTRRTENDFGFQLSYTYSHAIDDVSDIFDLSGAFSFAQDEIGRGEGLKAERGNANFDVRHRFTSGVQYELPLNKNNKYLGGWTVSGFLTLQTGQPFTVNTSLDVNYDGNLTDRLNTTAGLLFNDSGITRIRLAPSTQIVSLLAITDPLPLQPRNGSVGRNTFRAAGIASLDLALTKQFQLNTSSSLDLRLEAFNLFNRTHFAIPVRILEAPSFGSSVNSSVSARNIQFSLKILF